MAKPIIKSIKSIKGFTLLEVIVALAVLTTGILAALTLTTFNLVVSQTSAKSLLAANLARESLEVYRNKRDSNWLANLTWNTGLEDGNNFYYLTDFDATNNLWSIIPADNADISLCQNCTLKYNSDTGVYSHSQTGANVTSTGFKRKITTQEICWDEDDNQENVVAVGSVCSGLGQQEIGLQLTAEVLWTDNTNPPATQVVDKLYNWK